MGCACSGHQQGISLVVVFFVKDFPHLRPVFFVFRASVDSLSFISRTGIRPRTTSPSKTAQRASDNRGALRAPHQSFPAWGLERGRVLTHMSLAPNGDGSALGSYGEAQCRNLLL